MKILLVEDDRDLAEAIRSELGRFYTVEMVGSGEEGKSRAGNSSYDLLILDILLPDFSGIGLCRELRAKGLQTPVLMLTGRGDVEDKVLAFEAGADDYLTKPFRYPELLARVRALTRRQERPLIREPLAVGSLLLDSGEHSVRYRGRTVRLRRREFDLLEYLMRNAGRVVSRAMILDHVWESGIDPLSNTIDVHIKYLRDKIDRPMRTEVIKTVAGVGYTIET